MQRPTAATPLLLTTAAAFFGGFALTLEGLGPTEAPAAFDNHTNGFISQADRLMHDGLTLTFTDAILRHAGEATGVITAFKALTPLVQNKIITFLKSL